MLDVVKLWNEWQSLKKNKRRTPDPRNRRANFVGYLNTVFDIRGSDLLDDIALMLTINSFNCKILYYICLLQKDSLN